MNNIFKTIPFISLLSHLVKEQTKKTRIRFKILNSKSRFIIYFKMGGVYLSIAWTCFFRTTEMETFFEFFFYFDYLSGCCNIFVIFFDILFNSLFRFTVYFMFVFCFLFSLDFVFSVDLLNVVILKKVFLNNIYFWRNEI